MDRVLVQHDGCREQLARDDAADSRKGERPSRSAQRIVDFDPLNQGHDRLAALSARSAETSAASHPTGVAGRPSRRYAYAPFCAGRDRPVTALVLVKAQTFVMARLVMKFGGTSVADIDRIRNIARHVKREVDAGHDVAVVVSAMSGTTNQLVGWCEAAL